MAIEIIYGIECNIPDCPKINEIDGHTLPKKKQKFKKVELPESLYDIEFDNDGMPIYSPQQIDFITAELTKCRDGYWFMNNGVPAFITGTHY